MASIKTKFAVGLFVIIGFVLIVVAVVWLGMTSTFESGQNYVAYFDESVQGLDKDSPVKYRGVTVGRVVRIEVAPDATLIQTTLKIESGIQLREDVAAQLKSVGITGIMYLELDQLPPGAPGQSPRLTFPSKYPVIRTRPSEIKMFMASVNEILEQLKSLDLDGISRRTIATLERIDHTLEAAQVEDMSREIRAAVDNLTRILDADRWDGILDSVDALTAQGVESASRFNRLLTDNESKLAAAADHLSAAMEKTDRLIGDAAEEGDMAHLVARLHDTVAQAEGMFSEGASLVGQTRSTLGMFQRSLLTSLRQLERATANLNQSIERIADQPSRLFFDRPPPPRTPGNGDGRPKP